MLPVIFSLLLSASVPSACDDSMANAQDAALNDLGAVTPDDNPEDSCQWEAPRAQHPEWADRAQRESDRVSLSVAQAPHSPPQSTLRQQAEADGWKSLFKLRQDTLTRRQLAWSQSGWHLAAGDMNDPALPLWPRWLPRRALPAGWNAAASDAFFPATSIPQGFGVRVAAGDWSAFAVDAWDPVQVKNRPPWEEPWGLRAFSAGASASLPWLASLQFSQTEISRDNADSLANEVVSLGLSSPQKRLSLNGAWSSSGENFRGGWAWGANLTQPFGDSAKLAITVRERSADWSSPWDPTVSPDSARDSAAHGGAGEAVASLRVPFHLQDGKGFASGEAWGAWNPAAGTRKFGARGETEWRTRDLLLEARGMHRQWVNASGSTGFHDFLALETGVGKNPAWRTGAYRIWERASAREGLSFAWDAGGRTWRVRPGLLIESTKQHELSGSGTLDLHWKLGDGWMLEADGSAPCGPDPSWSEARWRATLRYLR